MTDRPATVFSREDTMLGVCEGLGQETGLPPLLFRIAFAVGLFWNPLAMIVGYLALGIALALFRWALPPRRATFPTTDAVAPHAGDNDDAVMPTVAAA